MILKDVLIEELELLILVSEKVSLLYAGCSNTPTLRFPTHHVHVTKCSPETKCKQNPYQTAVNIADRLKGTPCDAYAKRMQGKIKALANEDTLLPT